jgi:hypothetical protein
MNKSWALSEVFSFCEPQSLIPWQTLNKRVYRDYVPFLVTSVTMDFMKGFCILKQVSCLKVIDARLQWENLRLFERG